MSEDRGFLPLRVASSVASRFVNPRGRASEEALRHRVDGTVVLVTGASYGIGEATACDLAAAGATVLLVARSGDRLAEIEQRIWTAGGQAHSCPTDLSDPEQVDALVQDVLERYGHV